MHDHGDSDIIAALIEDTLSEGLDASFSFVKDGLNAVISLRPPHDPYATWNVVWAIRTPDRLDTGDLADPFPQLANPECQSVLIAQFKAIQNRLQEYCSHCNPPNPA